MAAHLTCLCGACKKCKRRVYMRDYYRRNRDRVCETARKTRERHAEKIRATDRARGCRTTAGEKRVARNAVRTALINGALVRQPCERCGEGKVDAHHNDYSRPLDVRWLCRKHHGEEHRRDLEDLAAMDAA